MNSSLKMALLGLCLFASTGVFAQSWTEKLNDADFKVMATTQMCDDTPYILLEVTNNQPSVIVPQFDVRYAHDGYDMKMKGDVNHLKARETVAGSCDSDDMMYSRLKIALPKGHDPDISGLRITKKK
jgi:hypothetical protein